MTRRVIEGRPLVSRLNEGYESRESPPPREKGPDLPSAFGASREDYRVLPVPEDQPAVNEPLQSEPLLTRLTPRVALRRLERLIEQC